ncbi:DrmB family protein [Scytonema sp. NUACC26]|uniref:DrmB family protein n=1 Tax=Scytonema sp. NUACC26 TaxID=3140176 RepID=UPI0034DCA3B7
MPEGLLRRAQLIAPFGVGAMVVVRNGTSLITAGIDHWYKREDISEADDKSEFRIDEWRLARSLEVDHFRQPPDFRKANKGDGVPNAYLTVPFLRFPQWHFCASCNLLQKFPLTKRGKVKCPECESKKKTKYTPHMAQVPIIAMCDRGHIQDFPWREWVHRSANPICDKPVRLVGTGSATLGGLSVRCDCGAKRSLEGITEGDVNRTRLSKTLMADDNTEVDDEKKGFCCQGKRPWLGTEDSEPCSCQLRGTLRSATNVYYAQTRSAIYLQRGNNSELVSLLEEPPLSTLIQPLSQAGLSITPEFLRGQHTLLLKNFSNEEIKDALCTILSPNDIKANTNIVEGDDPETSFRREEFNVLRTERNEENLKIRAINISQYESNIAQYFSRIMLVDKLKETRALTGFTRIFPETDQPLPVLQSLLWRQSLQQETWLPAYIVYGEGIFIEFNENRLRQWLKIHGAEITRRVQPLVARYERIQEERHLRQRQITPRFILLHTFAHLLMNRLTFECGYSSAALRERLYISENPVAPMAGVLIYTANGDSEGTMGGLVRMGKPSNFEPVVRSSLEAASWCSADPVCMEVGARGGQGPDSCNLAACHSCALVPETACEEFNRFLDRGVVIGDIYNKSMGFFT